MKIAQIYPHSVISVPHADVFDALAIVNYELGRRLARSNTVVSYPKWVPGQAQIEEHEGVTYRRVPQRIDATINLLRVLDNRVFKPDRPFRLSPLYYAAYAKRVARDIQERGCEVVHIHSVTNFIPTIRAHNPRARIVLHMHDHSLADFDAGIVASRLEQANLIVGCSNFVMDAVRKRFPRLADRCHTLYNGVDERFLGIDSDPATSRNVLFVGRLCPEKGVHVLVDALSKLPRSEDASLSLVGPLDVAPREFVDPLGADPLFADLRGYYSDPVSFQNRLVRSVSALRNATLHGKVLNSDIGTHYSRAGIFVFPSLWHEPFGIPVIEAMAAGLPVVATRGGALPEIVVDGETGLLVERGDVEGLRAAISRLLRDPQLRARMGAAGRERVRRMFTWDQCVSLLTELYASAEVSAASPQGLASSPPSLAVAAPPAAARVVSAGASVTKA